MPIDFYDYPPPALYDFPYKGPGNLIIVPDAAAVCWQLGIRVKTGDIVYGCSVFTWGGCLIVLPKVVGNITLEIQRAVRRIENANCNGEPRDGRE